MIPKYATQDDIKDVQDNVDSVKQKMIEHHRQNEILHDVSNKKLFEWITHRFKLGLWSIVSLIVTSTLYLKGFDYIAYFFMIISFVMLIWTTAKLE